ncbi:hypothetical protein MMC20_001250 [Loxospora ochrophaea]|nr:hypothetical protein [Loxospora ochrophaea]
MEKARMVLAKVYGSGSYAIVESVLRAVDREIMEENEATNERNRHVVVPPRYAYTFPWLTHLRSGWNELFRIGSNRRALTIACLLQGLQQLCGFNSLMYFSATIFSLIGFSSPTTPALSIALTNFTFTLLALLLIDRIGRRLILLLSIPIMILALTLCATSFSYLPISTSTSTSTSSPSVSTTPPPSPSPSPSPSLPALLILLAMTLYVSAYALGLGTVPWQQSELFPLSVRSLGSGLATGTNWAGNFIVGLSFLPMMEWLAPAWTFATYAVVCAAGWLCVWRFYPETKGLGLEEVGGLLRDGWGVGRERGGSVGRRRG